VDDEPTCGKGLAEHSALPARMGELADALAAVLERHQAALDLNDERAREELRAYVNLAVRFRAIAADLRTTAERMAGYRDLPMGRHDEQAMAAPEALDVFVAFVDREQALLALLETSVERDQGMPVAMRG
jgi:hypothetical protein